MSPGERVARSGGKSYSVGHAHDDDGDTRAPLALATQRTGRALRTWFRRHSRVPVPQHRRPRDAEGHGYPHQLQRAKPLQRIRGVLGMSPPIWAHSLINAARRLGFAPEWQAMRRAVDVWDRGAV